MKERRLFPRAKISCRITVVCDLRILVFNSEVENIGAGGLRVILKERLDNGTSVSLEVFPQDKEIYLKCKGEVIWSNEKPAEKQQDKSFDTGIKFIDINDSDKQEIKELVELFLSK